MENEIGLLLSSAALEIFYHKFNWLSSGFYNVLNSH